MHPHLIEILKELWEAKKSKKIYKIALLSNCLKLADVEYNNNISKYIDDVTVTLYDTDPKLHDSFTQIEGSFNKKVEAINILLKNKIKVHIKLLVINPSYKNLPKMVKYIVDKWSNKVHIAINATHYNGDAFVNKAKLNLLYEEAVPYIEEALDIAIQNKNPLSVFFPLCYIDPQYWKYSPMNYKQIIDNSISISPNYGLGKADRLLDEFINKNIICTKCILEERCNWPWKKYCEINGDNEIKKINQKIIIEKE